MESYNIQSLCSYFSLIVYRNLEFLILTLKQYSIEYILWKFVRRIKRV